jgi:predicted nucleic acid-binding protein|tara:strand:+ start:600 stop:986 length:387 start_codon:yes stop_codon:yes gene_type:complete
LANYLLDTTAIIDYLRDKNNIPGLLEKFCVEGSLLGCCPINIVEVYEGMRDKEKATTEEFLNSLECYEVTREIGIFAGELKRKYSKKGITLSIAHLIAAVAIKNHLILVTNNAKHFPEKEITLYCYGI